jgi:hypothetical protein
MESATKISRRVGRRCSQAKLLAKGALTVLNAGQGLAALAVMTFTLASARQARAQQIVLQNSSETFSEAYAFPFRNSSNVEEIVATGNSTPQGTQWYGCTNNNYSSWQNWNIGYSGDIGDPSGFGRSATSQAVIASIDSSDRGPRWYWTSDPCPASGTPSWQYWVQYTDGSPGTVDYTHTAYDPAYDQMSITWNQVVNGHNRLVVSRINSNFNWLAKWDWSHCSNISNHEVHFLNSVFDSNGDQHIVYKDDTSGFFQYEKYTRTGGFACINKQLGSFSNSPGSCSACSGTPTYVLGGANTCLKQTWNMSIAIANSSLIFTYSTPGSGSCNNTSETRVYESPNLGQTWNWRMVTGCQNSLQPRAAWGFSYSSFQYAFHVLASYAPQNSSQLAQVDWYSHDLGVTWGGQYLTGGYTPTPIGSCYWGDYQGATWDSSSGNMFYDWGGSQVSGGGWPLFGLTAAP